MKILSIIVPVYNIDSYLEECLDSLICNNYNYEIILINDGSTDKSLAICKSYAEKYSFIHLYNQENKGVSTARNIGIQKATGKFLYFVDGDDFLIGISSIIESLERHDADLYAIAYNVLYNDKAIKYQKKYSESRIYTFKDFYKRKDATFHTLWGFIFNREIINNNKILFNPKLKYSEDWLFVVDYFIKSKSVYTIPDAIYNYRLTRIGSAMNTSLTSQQLILHFYAFDSLSSIQCPIQCRYIIRQEKQIMMLHLITQIKYIVPEIRYKIGIQHFIRKRIRPNMFLNINIKNRLKLLLAYLNIKFLPYSESKNKAHPQS